MLRCSFLQNETTLLGFKPVLPYAENKCLRAKL